MAVEALRTILENPAIHTAAAVVSASKLVMGMAGHLEPEGDKKPGGGKSLADMSVEELEMFIAKAKAVEAALRAPVINAEPEQQQPSSIMDICS